MMLVGYEPGSKGYWLWNRSTRAIVLSHNVTFDERSFPFKEGQSDNAPALQPSVSDGPVTITFPTREPIVPTLLPQTPQNTVVSSRDTTAFFTPPSHPPQNTPPSRPRPVRIDTGLPGCYRLDKRLNCLTVGVTPPGSAVRMTRVSYTSRASVRGLASGHWSSRSVLVGCLSLVSGYQLYCLVGSGPYLSPFPIPALWVSRRSPYCSYHLYCLCPLLLSRPLIVRGS
jgi:hypothetical protein